MFPMFQVQSIDGLKSMYPVLTHSVFIAFLETLVGSEFSETDEMGQYNFGKKLYEETVLDGKGWVSIFRVWGTRVSGHYLLELGGREVGFIVSDDNTINWESKQSLKFIDDPGCSGSYVVVKETHLPSSMLGFSQMAGKYDAFISARLKNALAVAE